MSINLNQVSKIMLTQLRKCIDSDPNGMLKQVAIIAPDINSYQKLIYYANKIFATERSTLNK